LKRRQIGGYEFMNGRLTITEVAERVGVTPRTIRRWENARKVKKAKRDWRGWRVYDHDDIEEIISFHDTVS
jgi:DNA-binding transcriptional MerR regulator